MHDDPRPPLEPLSLTEAPDAGDGDVLALPAPAQLEPRRAPRGRSAGALAVVLALLVGAAGGFAGGRSSRSSHDAGGAGGETVDVTGTAGGAESRTSTFAATGSTSAGDSAAPAFDTEYRPPTVTRLFKRAVPGGELRVSKVEDIAADCRGNGCPPPECMPSGYYQAMIVGDWDVSMGGGAAWPTTDPARLAGVVMSGMSSTDGPAPLGLLVRTTDAVRTVRWVANDGTVRDQMAPQDGLAAVVAPATVDLRTGPFPVVDGSRIEALDAAGKVRATIALDDRQAMMAAFNGEPPESCRRSVGAGGGDGPTTATAVPAPVPAGPQLPAPGDQPADRIAAEAAVRATFAVALGNRADPAAANAAIDDPEGLQAARDASDAQFPQYTGKVRFEMTGLVFVSPTRAAFTYTVTETDKGQVLVSQVGGARLVDGRWLITRATVCNLLPVKPTGSC